MKRKILLAGLVIVAVRFLFGFSAVTGGKNNLVKAKNQGEYIQTHILEATVHLTIEVPNPESPYVTIMETGFGTVIHQGGETILVTHNHWKQLSAETGLVYIRNVNNQILFFSHLSDFRMRVRYRDEGTMIFKVPSSVLSYTPDYPISPDDITQPGVGDIVLVTHQSIPEADAGNSMYVTFHQSRVLAVESVNGVPVYKLQSLDGHSVEPGDSGGGVWFNGHFVANLWMTFLVESETISPTADTTHIQHPTDISLAAQFQTP